jgi:hypothetical protein
MSEIILRCDPIKGPSITAWFGQHDLNPDVCICHLTSELSAYRTCYLEIVPRQQRRSYSPQKQREPVCDDNHRAPGMYIGEPSAFHRPLVPLGKCARHLPMVFIGTGLQGVASRVFTPELDNSHFITTFVTLPENCFSSAFAAALEFALRAPFVSC